MANEARDKNEVQPAGPFVIPDVSQTAQYIEAPTNPVHAVQSELSETISGAAVVKEEALHLKPENIIPYEQFEAARKQKVEDASRWEAEQEKLEQERISKNAA